MKSNKKFGIGDCVKVSDEYSFSSAFPKNKGEIKYKTFVMSNLLYGINFGNDFYWVPAVLLETVR